MRYCAEGVRKKNSKTKKLTELQMLNLKKIAENEGLTNCILQ